MATIGIRDGKPAVCVKDRTPWYHDSRTHALIIELGEDVANAIYEGVRGDFWEDVAPDVARKHGYSGEVYSAGRSGGWLVLGDRLDFLDDLDADDPWSQEPRHSNGVWSADDAYENEALAQRDRFVAFAGAIEAAQHGAEGMYVQRLREAQAALNARREACIVKGEN